MRLLDSYLTRELMYPFLFGIAAFTSIIAGSSVLFPLISKAVKYGFSAFDTMQMFIYKLQKCMVLWHDSHSLSAKEYHQTLMC